MKHKVTTPERRNQPDATGQGELLASGLGVLWLVWSDLGLTHLALPGRPRPFAPGEGPPTGPVPARFGEPLLRYFAGENVDPARIPVDLSGTRFQVRVWQALRCIPRGAVRTYAGVAADVGSPRAMRAVGAANARNPIAIVVPCHRVVETGHRLGGYTGGLDRKRLLLRLEGVHVESDRVLPGQLDLL